MVHYDPPMLMKRFLFEGLLSYTKDEDGRQHKLTLYNLIARCYGDSYLVRMYERIRVHERIRIPERAARRQMYGSNDEENEDFMVEDEEGDDEALVLGNETEDEYDFVERVVHEYPKPEAEP